MAKSFIGRAGELRMLDRMWQSPKAELIILYGRRRVGKTRLLTLDEGPQRGRAVLDG